MVKVISLQMYHRGFEIGYIKGRYGFLAAWRSSLEGSRWTEGHVYVDSKSEIPQLARECIDFQYRVEVLEAGLGRKLTMEEITRVNNDS